MSKPSLESQNALSPSKEGNVATLVVRVYLSDGQTNPSCGKSKASAQIPQSSREPIDS